MKPLRFAPFIRVSTEKQENRGRSLQDQKTAIIGYVKTLGGTIPESCWQYTGQESASPDSQSEKRMFNRLLQDAKKEIFDAVIVCHTDRWSRDNKKSKEGVEILKTAGVRFFTGTTELDLFNPAHEMQLGVLTEFNEYAAKRLALASLLARIASAREQAEKGLAPINMRLPYGRIRLSDGTWGLDKEKVDRVHAAVNLYLDADHGKGIERIAEIVGIHHAALSRVLHDSLGDTWCREFKSHKFNISESVKYTIPALIEDPETIKAVHNQIQKNRSFTNANKKISYLLSNFVLCGECGSALSGGWHNSRDKVYYKHLDRKSSQCAYSKPIAYIKARLLESVVMAQLEDMFSSPEAIEQKVKEHCAGLPANEKSKTLTLLENEQRQLKAEIQRLMDGYAKGLFTDEELQPLIQEKRTRVNPLAAEIEKLQQELSNTPSEKEIKKAAQAVSKEAKRLMARKKYQNRLEENYRDDRKLIESVFAGKDAEGKRLGVYVWKVDGKWFYELRGNLPWVNRHGELAEDYYVQCVGSGNEGDSTPSTASRKYRTAKRAYTVSWGCWSATGPSSPSARSVLPITPFRISASSVAATHPDPVKCPFPIMACCSSMSFPNLKNTYSKFSASRWKTGG